MYTGKGVIVALDTPLKKDKGLDEKSLENIIRNSEKAGCCGILYRGETGNFRDLTERQTEQLLDFANDYGTKLITLFNIVQKTCKETISLSKRLSSNIDIAVISAKANLISHIDTISQEIEKPLFLYINPSIGDEKINKYTLMNIISPYIDGIKCSDNDSSYMRKIMKLRHKDISIALGDESKYFEFLSKKEKPRFIISGTANYAPEFFVDFYDNPSLEHHKKIMEFREIVYGKDLEYVKQGLKLALKQKGLISYTTYENKKKAMDHIGDFFFIPKKKIEHYLFEDPLKK